MTNLCLCYDSFMFKILHVMTIHYVQLFYVHIIIRKMLATHVLTHTFFDWLKFTWDPLNLYGTHMIWWDPCEF